MNTLCKKKAKEYPSYTANVTVYNVFRASFCAHLPADRSSFSMRSKKIVEAPENRKP